MIFPIAWEELDDDVELEEEEEEIDVVDVVDDVDDEVHDVDDADDEDAGDCADPDDPWEEVAGDAAEPDIAEEELCGNEEDVVTEAADEAVMDAADALPPAEDVVWICVNENATGMQGDGGAGGT